MPKGRPHSNLIGKTFGHLIIREKSVSIGNIHRLSWICECVCGKRVERRNDYLLSNKTTNFSCGCMHSSKVNNGSKSYKWKGVGEVSKQYMCSIKLRAKKSGRECSITLEEIWTLFQEQNGLCALTNFPINLAKSSRYPGTASLDRKDSTKGYTVDNVWWVHKDVNRMKNSYSIERFIEICNAVINNIKN